MLTEILEAMEKKKISKKTLSKKTGISERTLYNILKNEENFNKAKFKYVMAIKFAVLYSQPLIRAKDKVYCLSSENFLIISKVITKLSK